MKKLEKNLTIAYFRGKKVAKNKKKRKQKKTSYALSPVYYSDQMVDFESPTLITVNKWY